jgi:thiol-disulfide isomerase/thioredoxin
MSQEYEVQNFVLNSPKERVVFYDVLNGLKDNEIVVLNFTFVDCHVCKKEVPELNGYAKQNKKIKLFVVFAESGDSVSKKAKEWGLDTYYEDPLGTLQDLFSVKSYPVTFLINKKGKKTRFDGYNEKNRAVLKKELQ